MLAAGTMLGPYRILGVLGAGGMGEVYRASDTRLRRDVALKVIPEDLARDSDRVRRFEQEARAAGALSHPNVCAVHDVGTENGTPFVVMELLEGETVRARLAHGPVPPRKALELATQAARGLAAAHARGIVHRDLKPENLFLTSDGRVVILDFGLAKLTRPAGVPVSRMQTVTGQGSDPGAILGTVGYMAPEQVRGGTVDHRADVFALGVLLQEMVTARPVFTGPSTVEVLNAILHQDPAPIEVPGGTVPAGFESLVRRCLEKEPGERFQDMRDLCFDLETLARAESGSGRREAGGLDRGRRPRVVTVIRYAAVTLLGIAVGYVGGDRRAGGSPAEGASYKGVTFQRGIVTAARFSPVTGTLLYSAAWEGRPLELFESRPGIVAPRQLGLPGAHLLSVSSRGALLVMPRARSLRWLAMGSVGDLAVVPESGGEPHVVADQVASADWSPDGRTIVSARVVDGAGQVEMPPGRVVYRSRGLIGLLRVSPEGDRLAFLERFNSPSVRGCVTVTDTTGRVLARSREWRAVLGLAWSASGREVWYSASHDDDHVYDLRAIEPGARERVVLRMPGAMSLFDVSPDGRVLLARVAWRASIRGRGAGAAAERDLGWLDYSGANDISRDGQTLLFTEEGIAGGRNYSIWLRGMDGSTPVRIGEGYAQSFSPDGGNLLAIDVRLPKRMFVLPTGAGRADTLPRSGFDQINESRWLPDGRGVVFAGSGPARPAGTWVQAVGTDSVRPVTPPGVFATAVSPDGREVAGVVGDDFILYPLAGGDPRVVARCAPGDAVVGWSADGRSLFASNISADAIEVTRVELADGRRYPFATYRIEDPAGVSLYPPVLTRDGRAYAFKFLRWQDDLYQVTGLK